METHAALKNKTNQCTACKHYGYLLVDIVSLDSTQRQLLFIYLPQLQLLATTVSNALALWPLQSLSDGNHIVGAARLDSRGLQSPLLRSM